MKRSWTIAIKLGCKYCLEMKAIKPIFEDIITIKVVT